MRFGKICLRIATFGSTLLALLACSEDSPPPASAPPPPPPKSPPDLSDAIEKRIEGKTEEAIELLRKYNEEFPDSPEILIQLGRSLHDSGQYALSAFRLEQALSAGAAQTLLKEVAQAHEKAGDEKSARKRLRRISRGQPGGQPSLACSGPPAGPGRHGHRSAQCLWSSCGVDQP